MRCAHVTALSLLLAVFCQVVYASTGQLWPRGSRSPSPDHHGHVSGLLGDVVAQGHRRPVSSGASDIQSSKRPASSSEHGLHSSQSAHPSQAMHPSQATHSAHVVHSVAVHPSIVVHPSTVIHPSTMAHPSLSHTAHVSHSQTLNEVAALRPGRSTNKPPEGRPYRASKSTGRPVGRPRKPAKEPKPPKEPRLPKPKGRPGPRDPWWKKSGGKPMASPGTGKQYEIGHRFRERQKAKQAQGQHHDDHPPFGHQPPKGEGPGSPGAGSHAVTRRGSG